MSIAVNVVLKKSDDHVTADVDGEVMMMSIDQGEYYGLNPMGSRIWDLLSEPRSVVQLIDILIEEYEVDRATCEKDVMTFIEKLSEKGIVEKA